MLIKLLLLLTMSASATEPAKFTALEYKAPAPFAGILFDENALAKIMSDYDVAMFSCETETKYQIQIVEEEYKYKLENMIIEHKSLTDEYDLFIMQKDKEIELLTISLKNVSPQNKWLWFIGGVALGGASYYAIDRKLSK